MSLNWDVSRIEDKDWVWQSPEQIFGEDAVFPMGFKKGEKYLNFKLESIIWATMAVDFGEVTEKNVEEFYLRYLLWQKNIAGNPPYFSVLELKKSIGLSTNVVSRSMAAFKKDLWERVTKDLTTRIQTGQYDEIPQED